MIKHASALHVLGCWAHSFAGPTSSFAVETGGGTVLLDPGVDPIGRLAALTLDPKDVVTVYLSHLHSDHASGFPNFVFTRQLLLRGHEGPTRELSVVGLPAVIAGAQQLLEIQYPEREFDVVFKSLNPGAPTDVGPNTIELIENAHAVPTSGVKLTFSNTTIGYTADSAPFDSQNEFFRNVDILIGECFGLEADVGKARKRGHSSAEDLRQLVQTARPGIVIPFHFDQTYRNDMSRAELLRVCCDDGVQTRANDPVSNPSILLGK